MAVKPMSGRLPMVFDTYREHFLKVPPEAVPEDFLEQKFWVHYASQLTIDAVCTIQTENADGWRAEFLVIDLKKTGTGVTIPTLAMLNVVDLGAAKKTRAAGEVYRVEFRGAAKHVIIRESDKTIIERDIPTKAQAELRASELMVA